MVTIDVDCIIAGSDPAGLREVDSAALATNVIVLTERDTKDTNGIKTPLPDIYLVKGGVL